MPQLHTELQAMLCFLKFTLLYCETLMRNPRDFRLEVEKEHLGFGEELGSDLLRVNVRCRLRQPLCHRATPIPSHTHAHETFRIPTSLYKSLFTEKR